MSNKTERLIAIISGIVLIISILAVAILIPNPTAFSENIFRIIIAIASGAFAVTFTGFLKIKIGSWLRAGGALAVFVVVYFYNPAERNLLPEDYLQITGDCNVVGEATSVNCNNN